MAHSNSKQPPRFLPTLTEVVRQGSRASKAPDAASSEVGTAGSAIDVDLGNAAPDVLAATGKATSKSADKLPTKSLGKEHHLDQVNETLEVNISRVLLRLEAPMLAKIRLSVAELVDAHVRQLSPLIDKEIETIVREAVREGVTAELVRIRKQSG